MLIFFSLQNSDRPLLMHEGKISRDTTSSICTCEP